MSWAARPTRSISSPPKASRAGRRCRSATSPAASPNGSPMRSSLFLLPLLLAGCATTQQTPAAPALHAETFGPARGAQVRTLIVVLHSDGAPDHYRFAA